MKSKFIIISLIGMMSYLFMPRNLSAQMTCCPDFKVVDAISICPAEGACLHEASVPQGDFQPVMAACKLTPHVYTVYPNIPGYTYTWTITGGTPASYSGNPLSVVWGPGNTGHIKVVISNSLVGGNCRDSIDQDICLIDGPAANFTFPNASVCKNTPVQFTNTSIGGSVFYWDFGDGGTSNLANPALHSYSVTGVYTVTLVVTDMGSGQLVPGVQGGEVLVPCGCTSRISKVITVQAGDGPDIVTDCCYGTVCPGDTSSFCTSMTCGTYVWSVTNGLILSGQGSSCITVKWNMSYSVTPTVTLQSCPGASCPGATTLNVPVLYPNLPITGPSVLCIGATGAFSLPSMPGTYYKWTVSGGLYTFNQADKNVSTASISFHTPGLFWVKCQYRNPLAGCNGVDSIQVNVEPEFSISGNDIFCEGEMALFSASGPALWTFSSPGPVILSGNGTSSVTVTFPPGPFVVIATPLNPAAYCNTNANKKVNVVAKPILGSISGPLTVCPGNNVSYSITSNVTGSPFVWSIASGTGTILSQMGPDKEVVLVSFSGTGPWVLNVYQQIEISPGNFCSSIVKTLTVNPFTPPLFTGNATVCIDAVETYIATGSDPMGNFQWTISPSNRGTIQTGQGTGTVIIQWHGPPTTAVLQVNTCSGNYSMNITINGPPATVATYNTLPVFCLGSPSTLVLSTPFGPGYSFQWYKGNTPVPGGNLSTLNISIPSFLVAGVYQYHVLVTVNGCTSKSNIINVVINDCSGNPVLGTGANCDVLAFFNAYVVCNQITLVNNCSVIPPAFIASYSWTLTGPGIGTFSPNAAQPSPGLVVSASGTYTIVLTITSSTGCTSTWSQIINVLLPVANFSLTSPVCVGIPALFSALPNLPANNYAWNFGDGSTSFAGSTQHSYSNAGTYTVSLVISDPMGCTAAKDLAVVANPTPSCSLNAHDTLFCPGDSVLLSVCTGMNSYQWFRNGNPISGATGSSYYVSQFGNYWVQMSNSFGCTNNSDSSFIYMNAQPVAKISGSSVVCGNAGAFVQFYLGTYFNTNYSYNWTSIPVGATFAPANSANPLVSLTLPMTLPLNYLFIVQVTDTTTGCLVTDTFCVMFFENPPLMLPYLGQCEGTAIPLSPLPNNMTNYSYQWSNGATNAAITAIAPGFYSLTITDKATGCQNWANAGSIYAKPDLSLFPLGCKRICGSDTLFLYIPLPLNATGPYTTYPPTYPVIKWFDNGNFATPIGFGQTISIPSTNSGSHQYSVVVVNNHGCSDTTGVFCLTDNLCCQIISDTIISHSALCPQVPNGWFSILLSTLSTGGPFFITCSPSVSPFPTMITPGIPLVVSNLAPGVYVITISNGTGGCLATYDVIIGQEKDACCFAEADTVFHKILTNTTYSSDMVWDGKYYLADNVILTVTNNAVLDITTVDVVFGECAGIVFVNGGRLRATNSVFRPCEIDRTWKGLRFSGTGKFDNIINECTFKNAEVALYFQNQADAVISNNLFSNCNYGIRVEGTAIFNHPISGNHFVTEDFFPNYSCTTKYNFVNNMATYGIYSTASTFNAQISQNWFVNSKGVNSPRTYGIYQVSGGGVISKNTFTDQFNSIFLQSQLFYSSIENNDFESNSLQASAYPSVFVIICNGPIIEVNGNRFSNTNHQFLNFSAIYSYSSNRVSIANNIIDGFNYGILATYCKNHQISNNSVTNSLIYGIYVSEQINTATKSFITCNSVKMKNYTSGSGFLGINLNALSEVSSNCITDCYISMSFQRASSNPGSLPLIRNNYLYNYYNTGINVIGCSGNIGASGSPGMNTLYSNKNSAIDINSNSTISVADNFGMFNIAFPFVQITSNNPYHSTASCGHQIFNMPSQGNLNINYVCDHYLNLIQPLTGTGGGYKLAENYGDLLSNSSDPYSIANLILSSIPSSESEFLNQIIGFSNLSENEKARLRFEFWIRNQNAGKAKSALSSYIPQNTDESDLKSLLLFEADILESDWTVLTDADLEKIQGIMTRGSDYANLAVSFLNNSSTYRDHFLHEPLSTEGTPNGNIRHFGEGESYLNIYPNPTTGKVFIEVMALGENSVIQILDISGKVVSNYTMNLIAGGYELDVQSLMEGFYLICLIDPSSGILQKGKLLKINSGE